MRNHEWENMSDANFDEILESSISKIPPEDIVAEVNPWTLSINRILVGMALTTFTLNFLLLDYLLPAIGVIMQLLGFRTLRKENKWFKSCFVVSVVLAAHNFLTLLLNTTIMRQVVYSSPIRVVLIVTNVLFTLIQLICLWRGFLAIQQKAGTPPRASGAAALIVWYVFANLLAVIQYSGWIIGIIMIIVYIRGIRSLYKLSKELDEAGYVIQTTLIKITDRCVVISIVLFLLVGSVCGYVFGSSYHMEWSVLNLAEHKEVENIKAHLISLGFPEYVLKDLSAEDIKRCEGALKVVVGVKEYKETDMGFIVPVEVKYISGDKQPTFKFDVFRDNEPRITGVGVQVPGERERWILFHHFLWLADPEFYGTEALQLWPVYEVYDWAYESVGNVTGRVLYDEGDETFVSDYYSLGSQTYTSTHMIWGNKRKTDVYATFSMPRKGENHRGYVAYPVEEIPGAYVIGSWCNYIHQKSWMEYPVMTAMERGMKGSWLNENAFNIIYGDFQFSPWKNGKNE